MSRTAHAFSDAIFLPAHDVAADAQDGIEDWTDPFPARAVGQDRRQNQNRESELLAILGRIAIGAHSMSDLRRLAQELNLTNH